MPIRSQNKIKIIGHAIRIDTLIISSNFNISHCLTCPKTWGEGPKTLKILLVIFLKFEHLPLLNWVSKETKIIRHATMKELQKMLSFKYF